SALREHQCRLNKPSRHYCCHLESSERRAGGAFFSRKNRRFPRVRERKAQVESLLHRRDECAAHIRRTSVITKCAYRVDGRIVRAVVAGLALSAFAAAPAAA